MRLRAFRHDLDDDKLAHFNSAQPAPSRHILLTSLQPDTSPLLVYQLGRPAIRSISSDQRPSPVLCSSDVRTTNLGADGPTHAPLISHAFSSLEGGHHARSAGAWAGSVAVVTKSHALLLTSDFAPTHPRNPRRPPTVVGLTGGIASGAHRPAPSVHQLEAVRCKLTHISLSILRQIDGLAPAAGEAPDPAD